MLSGFSPSIYHDAELALPVLIARKPDLVSVGYWLASYRWIDLRRRGASAGQWVSHDLNVRQPVVASGRRILGSPRGSLRIFTKALFDGSVTEHTGTTAFTLRRCVVYVRVQNGKSNLPINLRTNYPIWLKEAPGRRGRQALLRLKEPASSRIQRSTGGTCERSIEERIGNDGPN